MDSTIEPQPVKAVMALRERMLSHLSQQLPVLMPSGSYQQFYGWAISDKNPLQDDWLQMIGLDQSLGMTFKLLNGVHSDPRVVSELLDTIPTLATYLLFETISDNMAFGGAPWATTSVTHQERSKALLLSFNNDMIARIDDPYTERELNQEWLSIASKLSGIDQSLSQGKQKPVIEAYLQAHPETMFEAIEYGCTDALIANLNSCAAMVAAMEDTAVFPLFKRTLRARYEGINRLLEDDVNGIDDLLAIGTNSILVITVLSYYSSHFAAFTDADLSSVLNSTLFERTMGNAAKLTRMLNDMGTPLLKDAEHRDAVFDDLHKLHAETGIDDVFRLISEGAKRHVALTRLQKDIDFGEFNIALHGLPEHRHDVTKALHLLQETLMYCGDVYEDAYTQLMIDIPNLTQQMGHTAYAEMALRFVLFHEKLYSNSFKQNDGEYAV